MMRLPGQITVNIGVLGKNGVDVSPPTDSSWYHVWLIRNPTSEEVAGLTSLSASAPTMPAGFTEKRWIGVLRRSGSGRFPVFYVTGMGRDKTLFWAGTDSTGGNERSSVLNGAAITSTPASVSVTGRIPPDNRCRWGLFSSHGYCPETAGATQDMWVEHNNGGGYMWRTYLRATNFTAEDFQHGAGFTFEMPVPADVVYTWVTGTATAVWWLDVMGFRYEP